MAEQITPDKIDFWVPVRVFPSGVATTINTAPRVPDEVEYREDDDYTEQVWPWVPVKGKSNQHGYDGPLFHPSEFIGPGLFNWMCDNPEHYVCVPVEDPEDPDMPAGWLLLQHPAMSHYDTGKVLEPKLWNAHPFSTDAGKVDFDDDEGTTVFTVRFVKQEDGGYTMELENHTGLPIVLGSDES